jgi:hypothetical protein
MTIRAAFWVIHTFVMPEFNQKTLIALHSWDCFS